VQAVPPALVFYDKPRSWDQPLLALTDWKSAKAIVLDLMDPTGALRRVVGEGGKTRQASVAD